MLVLALAAAGGGGAYYYLYLLPQEGASPEPAHITVEEIVNRVETERLTAEGSAELLAGAIGLQLQPGDAIRTYSDSEARVDITIRELKRITRTTPNTAWRIGEFGLDRDTIIELANGSIFLMDQGGFDDQPGLAVVTPTGVASVRGTWLAVFYDEETGIMELHCFRGTCELSNELGVTVLRDGEKSTIIPGFPPSPAEPMTEEDIRRFLGLPEVLAGVLSVPEPTVPPPVVAGLTPTPAALPVTPTPEPTPDISETTPTPTPAPPTPTATPSPTPVPTFQVDFTGSCPQRSGSNGGAGSPPAIPMIVSGEVTLAGEPAPDGMLVVVLLEHATLGRCWMSPVSISGGRYNVALSPPAGPEAWLPPRYFVAASRTSEPEEATPSFELTFFQAGQRWPVDLAVEEALEPAPEGGVVITEVDTTGSCPQRGATGSPPPLPMLVSGEVLIDGTAAGAGAQVVAVLAHPTEGLCWHLPVQTDGSSRFLVDISPPTADSGWFPIRVFVNGVEAEVEPELDFSTYSPGAAVSVVLSVTSP